MLKLISKKLPVLKWRQLPPGVPQITDDSCILYIANGSNFAANHLIQCTLIYSYCIAELLKQCRDRIADLGSEIAHTMRNERIEREADLAEKEVCLFSC